MTGALAGVVGVLIYIVIGVPLAFMFRSSAMGMLSGMMGSMPPDQRAAMEQAMAQSGSVASILMNVIMIGVILVVCSTLGGLIGVAIFEKRKGDGVPPPPPPPNFGGPAGGSYGAGS